MMSSVVLVHGHMHGSWCWQKTVDGLAMKGIASIAVDLPGRGANKDRSTDLEEGLKVIDEAIAQLNGSIVLCGHSAGGVPISWAATRNRRIADIVYMSAILPLEDKTMAGFIELSMRQVGHRMRFENGYSRIASFQDAIDVLYNDCSLEDARWAYDRLIPEPFSGLPEADGMPAIKPWEYAKMTYAVCARDASVDPDAQRRIATRAHEIVELSAGHSPWLSQPQLCIDLLERVATEGR